MHEGSTKTRALAIGGVGLIGLGALGLALNGGGRGGFAGRLGDPSFLHRRQALSNMDQLDRRITKARDSMDRGDCRHALQQLHVMTKTLGVASANVVRSEDRVVSRRFTTLRKRAEGAQRALFRHCTVRSKER